MSNTSLLRVVRIKKSFSTLSAIDDVSFEVAAGEIICLLGPSGCGKTTLLRIIAGLELADSGTVVFEGHDLKDVPIHERGFGLMFQDFALFPHKNVWDNVIFGLRMQNLDRDQILQQGAHALELVGLGGFESRDVNELSGGEQQRVALARSLAPQPKLLMLDEPLGSLDRKLREELMIELRRILKAAELTSIYVTHDQQEAFALADRVVIMNAGHIEQVGSPQAVYNRPGTEFVARFLGLPNLVEGTVASATTQVASVLTPVGLLNVRIDTARSLARNQAISVLIRPDAATIRDEDGRMKDEDDQSNHIEGILIDSSFRGRYNRVVIRVDEVDLTFEVEVRSDLPKIGVHVKLSLNSDSIVIL